MEMNKEICRYLSGEMDAQSEKDFEQKLRHDEELRKEFELRKEIQNAVGEDDVMDLRERLSQYDTSETGKKRIRAKKVNTLTAAAFISLIIGIGMLWIYHFQMTNPNELFSANFEPYPSIYSQRIVETDTEKGTLKEKAFLAYEMENWEEARGHFDKLLRLQPENPEYAFYGGVVELKLNDARKAIKRFRLVLEQDKTLLKEQTIWYIALAHLKLGNVDRTAEYLQKIINEDMTNKEKALELLRKIE